MKCLINCSNLKQGGGIQVADSICRELHKFSQHRFIVVLSSYFKGTLEAIASYPNIKTYVYDVKNNLSTLVWGRDVFLDRLVKIEDVEVVLTVFGPSRWNPRCIHLSGFALAFLVMKESPYFQRMRLGEKIKQNARILLWRYFFKRSTRYFYTENSFITERLAKLLSGSKVFTVTNYYNQIFDNKVNWQPKELPSFEGITLLNISNSYPHKNLEIALEIVKVFRSKYPDFKYRFVFTINQESYPKVDDTIKDCILFLGSVAIAECPTLYEQCDIVFQPSLLECFTAAYPEAMRMGVPIVTTDLAFAKGLCGDAACYYSAIDAKAAAEAIYKVATDKLYAARLVANGKARLKLYDNYEQRVEKLIGILEEISN